MTERSSSTEIEGPTNISGPTEPVDRSVGGYRSGLESLPLPPAPESMDEAPRWGLAGVLLTLTVLTTTTLCAVFARAGSLSEVVDINASLFLSPGTIRAVWSDPEFLQTGLIVAGGALFILLCHELGHYLTCRYYKLPVTLPYFLPAPFAIGTFGAFIRIKAPIRRKAVLFDVGISGPIAGFVVLIPILVLGIAWSYPVPVEFGTVETATGILLRPGNSLLTSTVAYAFHGSLPNGIMLEFHPLVFAAWFGLLATAFNLIPLGQLDGGHVLYAVAGRWQRRLALPLWFLLAGLGFLWPGWWLWCVIVAVMGFKHPPVADDDVPLDRRRRRLAWLALAIFVLCLMPIPITEILVTSSTAPVV